MMKLLSWREGEAKGKRMPVMGAVYGKENRVTHVKLYKDKRERRGE